MSWIISKTLMKGYENSHSSRVPAEVSSVAYSSDGGQSAPSKSTHTPQVYLSPDKMTAFSRLSRFGMTFEPLMADRGKELLMWFRAGFHVSHSAMRESGITRRVKETYGQKHPELFQKSEHHTFCLKMCQEFANTCQWSYETCEELAIPSKGQSLLRREAPEHYKSESASGYLPACTARDGSGSGTGSARRRGLGCKHGLNLRDWFRTFFNLVYPPVGFAHATALKFVGRNRR